MRRTVLLATLGVLAVVFHPTNVCKTIASQTTVKPTPSQELGMAGMDGPPGMDGPSPGVDGPPVMDSSPAMDCPSSGMDGPPEMDSSPGMHGPSSGVDGPPGMDSSSGMHGPSSGVDGPSGMDSSPGMHDASSGIDIPSEMDGPPEIDDPPGIHGPSIPGHPPGPPVTPAIVPSSVPVPNSSYTLGPTVSASSQHSGSLPLKFPLGSLRTNCCASNTPNNDTVWEREMRSWLQPFLATNRKEYSCINRCGVPQRDASVALQLHHFNPRCYCDDLCERLGDCCYDFSAICGGSVGRKFSDRSASYESCWNFQIERQDETSFTGFVARSSCPMNWKDEIVREKCQDEDQTDLVKNHPVFDKTSNRTYKNMYCATCDGAKNTTYWQLKVTCDNSFTITDDDIDNIMDLVERNCSVWLSPEKYQRQGLKTCIPRFLDCSEFKLAKGKNDTYCQAECLRYALPVCSGSEKKVRYRNLQCALCNGVQLPKNTNGNCDAQQGSPFPPLTILFDFQSTSKFQVKAVNKEGSVIKQVEKQVSCRVGEVYDPYQQECKPLITSNLHQENTTDGNLNCTLISLNESEYLVFPNKSVYVRSHRRLYNSSEYTTLNNTLLLCVNFSRNATTIKWTEQEREITQTLASLGLLSSVGCVISIVSLILLLVTYILFAELRNLPGKIVINLTSSLLLYQLIFFLAVDTSDKVRCLAIAVLLHFFALSSFMWMNVMAFDIHRTFTASGGGPRGQDKETKRLLKYFLYGWGTPTLFMIVCLVLDNLNHGSIGYGKGDQACFISNSQALLYSFVLPVGILMVFNLIALGNTLRHIIKTRKIAKQVTNKRPSSSMTWICVKMMSVMGVTWLLGVAANVHALWFLWYPFVVLNSLQGFLIFLSFAVSGRALQLIKSKVSRLFQMRLKKTTSRITLPSVSDAVCNSNNQETRL